MSSREQNYVSEAQCTPSSQEVPAPTASPVEPPSPPAAAATSSVVSESGPAATERIGYGKPPAASRFKPGQSGNPRGRPRRQPTPEEALAKLMSGKITVSENGVTKEISRREAFIHQIYKVAIKGNTRAMGIVLQMTRQHELDNATKPDPLHLQGLSDEEVRWLVKIKIKSEKHAFAKEVDEIKKRRGLRDEDLV